MKAKLFVCLVLMIVFPVVAWGQVDRASLAGTVTDKSGAFVPGAQLGLVATDTGWHRDALSSDEGVYNFSLLPIGNYTLTVTMTGFQTQTIRDVRLGVGDTRTLNIRMDVSSVETLVTVEDVLQPLERTSAVVGTVVGARNINEMPLNGRHWASLMALAPGAVNTGEGNQQSIRFVGRARDDNNWTLDGVDATGVKDPRQEAALRLVISTDTVAEFRVNTTLYSAESGGGAGGQVNIVSKSGTNNFPRQPV